MDKSRENICPPPSGAPMGVQSIHTPFHIIFIPLYPWPHHILALTPPLPLRSWPHNLVLCCCLSRPPDPGQCILNQHPPLCCPPSVIWYFLLPFYVCLSYGVLCDFSPTTRLHHQWRCIHCWTSPPSMFGIDKSWVCILLLASHISSSPVVDGAITGMVPDKRSNDDNTGCVVTQNKWLRTPLAVLREVRVGNLLRKNCQNS